MSSLTDKLRAIEFHRRSIESHGKLPDEVLRKIEYKYRLECNYNSNKIEGGTLTKSETRSVMTGNITVEGKPLKDIREMQGHDEAMKDMGPMNAISRSIKKEMETLDSLSPRRDSLRNAVSNLERAEEEMMN